MVVILLEQLIIQQAELVQHQLARLERLRLVELLPQPIDLLMLELERLARQRLQLKSAHLHQRKAFDLSEGGILH